MKHTSPLSGYTLIEILSGVIIVSIVTLSWFYGINAIGVWNIKLVEKTQLEQQAFYFSERFFEMVKQSWTLDYEEYFNRQNVGSSSYLSGHYDTITWFWNGATQMIHCVSKSGSPLAFWGGCISDFNIFWSDASGTLHQDYLGSQLLFWQYTEQFIDYNSDADGDRGDENSDGSIVGDDDDSFTGNGPDAFAAGDPVTEIYLINSQWNERTFFRWYVVEDPDKPSSAVCDFSDSQFPTGEWCLGTLQFLKLKWVDWGNDHNLAVIDGTQNDGIIDTWVYDADTYGLVADQVADIGTPNSEDYWLPIFSDGVNVQSIQIYAYPNKDSSLSWADTSSEVISPYLRVSMNLLPSWKNKRKIRGDIPEVQINTTINLTQDYN